MDQGIPRILWYALAFLLMAGVTMAIIGCVKPHISLFPAGGPLKESVLEGEGKEKVLVIPVEGTISDRAERGLLRSRAGMVRRIMAHLDKARQDDQVKAILLKVDSPGGPVTAADLIYHELMEFKKKTGKKIVVSMMNVAASGGYYVSLPADLILAHPTTITGSVGVIFMRPQVNELMGKAGVAMRVTKTGANKDMGSPFRDMSEEEQTLFQSMMDRLADRFFSLVQEHRHLTPEALATVKTARVFLADEAKSLGLIDEVGYLSDAVAAARRLAGLSGDAKVVIYRQGESPDDNIYNSAGTQSDIPDGAPASIGISTLLVLPESGFYYQWPVSLAGS